MPDPFERHARPNRWGDDWGPRPARSQQRGAAAADDTARSRAPARKDPALCKAAHWGPHQPVLTLRKHAASLGARCRWDTFWDADAGRSVIGWRCEHEETCSGCGRVLRDRVPRRECPEFRPIEALERAALEAQIAAREPAVAAWRRRRPVIAGPQGYRRKRAS